MARKASALLASCQTPLLSVPTDRDQILRRGSAVCTPPAAIDPAERILGRLSAQLEYAEAEEIFAEGIGTYLQRIQSQVAETALAVQKAYFFH